jgi:hypothetical protein
MRLRKTLGFAAAFVAVAALLVVLAGSAVAEPNSTLLCDACHSGAGPAPTVTLVSDNGTTASYSVQQTGSVWAAFDGSSRIAGDDKSTGTFSGPSGHGFSVYSVSGFPGPIGVTKVGTQPITYTITPSVGAHGSISPGSAQTVAKGASVTFTIKPDAGYKVADVLVNGASVGAVTSYTFSNVAADGTISATFAVQAQQKTTVAIALVGLKSGAIKKGKTLTVKGAVAPARSGKATVTVQRKSGSKWIKAKTISCTINAANGIYSATYRPTATGSYRVQTTVAAGSGFTAGSSTWKSFTVK